MSAVLAPVDPNFSSAADADPARRDMLSRMAAAVGLKPAPLSLDEARNLRDEKMRQVLEHAERVSPGWARVAYLFIVQYARLNQRFIAQDVVRASVGEIDQPHDARAWGQTFREAAKAGVVKADGFAPAPHRHASPAVCWASLIYRRAA